MVIDGSFRYGVHLDCCFLEEIYFCTRIATWRCGPVVGTRQMVEGFLDTSTPCDHNLAPVTVFLTHVNSRVQGAQSRVRFDPPVLEMGPVLPSAPQGDVQEVTVLNEGSWDVEIFSLDFDKVTSTCYWSLSASHRNKSTEDEVASRRSNAASAMARTLARAKCRPVRSPLAPGID